MTENRLIQEGYMYVASFNHKDRAMARAEHHKAEGHDARIVKKTDFFGNILYMVYIKM